MVYLNEEIGKRIAGLRKSRHMTQEELAEKLNITVKHCSCVERGISSMSLELFIELCDIFDTSLDYIIRGKTPVGTALLPESFVACLENANEQEHSILRSYMELYPQIRGLHTENEKETNL